MLYIRSLEHYISRDFIKSLNSVGLCLEDAPDFWQVWYLMRTILNWTETDELLGAFFMCYYCSCASYYESKIGSQGMIWLKTIQWHLRNDTVQDHFILFIFPA